MAEIETAHTTKGLFQDWASLLATPLQLSIMWCLAVKAGVEPASWTVTSNESSQCAKAIPQLDQI